MRLLYIASVDFYTKPNPSFHLMTSMLQDVLTAGIGVDYIGCAEEGLERHIPDELAHQEGFSYQLVPTRVIEKSHFVNRYLDGIRYAVRIGSAIRRFCHTSDVIYVQSSPTVLYTLLSVKQCTRGKKVIYNVQDMFPGSSIASGVMPKRWMQQVFFRLQKIAYNQADIIVAISDDMKTKLMEQGVPESKIRVIVNWFDDKTVQEIAWNENRFVRKYAMTQERFCVQYAGTMGYVFDYRMVIEVARLLRPYRDIDIQMIGEGSQKARFIEEAQQSNIENIAFLPLENQDMVSDVYSACNVCFIPLKRGVIGNSVPSKAGLLMACKRAIVTSVDENSYYYRMINENNIGIAVPNDDPQQAAEAILRLYRDRKLCIEMGWNGYAYGHEQYSRSRNVQEYIHLFQEMGDVE
ncbi:MAG: glycosyltransferase family 4 protein [Clostridia bacterium]